MQLALVWQAMTDSTEGAARGMYGIKIVIDVTCLVWQAMTDAMKGAARAMKGMNASVDAKAMSKILADFEKESSLMDDKQVSVALCFTLAVLEMSSMHGSVTSLAMALQTAGRRARSYMTSRSELLYTFHSVKSTNERLGS